MTFVRTLALVLGATLVPTVAMADVHGAPDAPQPTQKPARDAAHAPNAIVLMPTLAGAPPPPSQAQTPPIVISSPDQRTTGIAPPERYYELHDAWNRNIFATGAVVFAGTFGVSALVAGTSDHVGADKLWIPLVGPWIALAEWDNDCPLEGTTLERSSCASTGDQILLGISGGLQAFALVTMIGGRFIESRRMVYATRAQAKKDATAFHFTPTRNGVAVMGKF